MDTDKPGSDGTKPDNDTTGKTPASVVGVQQEEPAQYSDASKSERNQIATEERKEILRPAISLQHRRHNPFPLIWNWVKQDTSSTDWLIVILTTVIAGTSYLQWREIRAGSTDTHLLAQAADAQAKKMGTMSDAADKIKEAAQGMVTQEQRVADNGQKSMDASSAQSKAALDASIAAYRSDQRAWVGAVATETPRDLAVGKQGIFGWVILNSGKTPALDVEQEIAAWPFTKGQECSPVYAANPAGTPKHAITVLQPGMRVTVWTNPQMRPNTEQNINNLKAGNEIMCVYGRLTYNDIFRRRHHTQFCAWLDTDLTTLNMCTGYNDAD